MELVGPLRPQALRVRHGYWLAASWRLETAQVGAKARRLTWMGGGGIDGGRAAAPAAMSWLANSRLPLLKRAKPRQGPENFTSFEGTSEIQRMLIGRTVTGLDVR